LETAQLYELYLSYPSVQTDTRKIAKGDIFFALKGPNFNGNHFVQQALDAGASYAVADEADASGDERCILVPDVLQALQDLAHYHRQQFSIPFIGITGSNGKTTSKELLTAVLRQQYKVYATQGNLNNHIGVPLTILSVKKDADIAVIEMGANHIGEIAAYCRIALPTHGIITNCGKAHLEGFGSIEGVRKGKGELYDHIRATQGVIFRNADLDYLEEMARGIHTQITYGTTDAVYTGQASGDGLLLNVGISTEGYETTLYTQLVGSYNFPNVLLAFAVGAHFGLDIRQIKTAVESYAPDNSRSQLLHKGNNYIILDAYNANPTSMRAAIANFARTEHPRMLWLGAMKEMGPEEAKEHEDLVTYISQWDWEEVILVGTEFRPFHGNYQWFATAEEATVYVAAHKPEKAQILVKGSRGSKMETLLAALN